jgi:homoserine O-succinyltransferase/O-acetyltransferase
MPIVLEQGAPELTTDAGVDAGIVGADVIEIGLVNNMPDAALETTERQFVQLLRMAARELTIRLHLFALPDVPRGPEGRRYLRDHLGIDALRRSGIDGLIVTGTEPRAASLTEEPYWETLAGLVDWAREHTLSTIWSCLAAHAAVLQLDGIGRRALGEKRLGMFSCAQVASHALTTGLPARFGVAHSRHNELSEKALASCGYRILTRSPEAGVDTFVRDGDSLFVFFQGHPEYDERALLREFRRDVGRFLRGERDGYPAAPLGYFGEGATAVLARYREAAQAQRGDALLASFPLAELTAGLLPFSRLPATCIYENWLGYLNARKLDHRRRRSPASRIAEPAQSAG